MKILMISTDRNIFKKNSAVRQRMIEYGELVDRLDIIVYTKRGYEEERISENTYVYPTSSHNKYMYVYDAWKISKNLKKIDIVTTQDPFDTGIAGWIIARSKKIKLHIQIHADFLSKYFIDDSRLNKIRVRISRFVLPKADGIRVVSTRLNKSLASHAYQLKKEPVVLPVFVDIWNIQSVKQNFNIHEKYPQFEFIALSVSRLVREKNLPLAICAFEKIVRKYPKTGLIIVGEGEEYDKLKRKVLKMNLQDNVLFAGWKDDFVSYFKTADMFLNTSNYEGYGMTIIEAAAAGCPIVTTDVGVVNNELSENATLVCPVGDEKCLTHSMSMIMENKSLRKKLAEESVKYTTLLARTKKEYLYAIKRGWEECLN